MTPQYVEGREECPLTPACENVRLCSCGVDRRPPTLAEVALLPLTPRPSGDPPIEVVAWRCGCWGRHTLDEPRRDVCLHCGQRWRRIVLREVRS